MSYPVQYAPANSVVYFPFATFGKTNGQSITLTGLAVTDIEVYKLPSMTQRASDAGYALLDTDGIDLDGITGIHGFSIDLANNSDAGFYTVGNWYLVVVSAVTVDAETLNFVAGLMRIMQEENPSGLPQVDLAAIAGTIIPVPAVAGVLKVDVVYNNGVAMPSASGRQEVNTTQLNGSAVQQANGIIKANMVQISDDQQAADDFEKMLDGSAGAVNLFATVQGINGITFPTNLALLAIDLDGVVKAHIEKINDKEVAGAGTATDPWRPAS